MTPEMTKTDIETLIDWLISESNDGAIEIHNVDEFSNNVRGVFRELHKMNCKNFAGGKCLQGGRCDGNCQRMKNYDKKFLNKEDNERNSN